MDPGGLHGPWSAIRRAPMVRLALPFTAGIALGLGLQPPTEALAALTAATGLPLLVLLLSPVDPAARWRRGMALSAWLVVAGMAWQALRAPHRDPLGIGRGGAEGPWLVRVSALNAVGERRIVVEGEALARCAEHGLEPRRGRLLLTLLREDAGMALPEVGDAVWVDGEVAAIDRVPDPGGFDRTAWARGRGLSHELFAPARSWRIAGHERRWTDAFIHARARISAWLDASGMAARELALVKALVLGLRDELDGGQRAAFARSGTIHVLAVSGMHVGLVYAALAFALGGLGRSDRARWARGMLVLAALWGYAGLTGAAPSVVRAAFMFSLFALAGLSRRQPDHLNSLFAAAFFLLLFDPGLLTQAGFQLSFLAVLGIILFYGPISAIWSPGSWLLRKAWGLVAVSASAQLLTAPLSMVLFKAFPVWFLPANLVVVAAVGLAVYGGVALIALGWVPLIGEAIALALQALLRFVGAATAFFGSLPGAYPAVRIGWTEAVVLYAMILLLAAWWQWRWRRMPQWLMASAAALALAGAWRAKHTAERALFVVYDDPRSLLAGMEQSRTLVVAAAADGALVSDGAIRRLDRHARAHGIARVVPAGTDLFLPAASAHAGSAMGGGRWLAEWIDVRFLSDGGPAMPPGACDVLVAHDLGWVGPEAEQQVRAAGLLVIGPGVRWGAARRLLEWAQSADVEVHDMKRHGALVRSRNQWGGSSGQRR